jgi:peptide/nickel transport system substrate-binding protein
MNAEGGQGASDPRVPCEHPNGSNSRFCDLCGARLPLRCPRCSATNRGEARFCKSCGTDLRDSEPIRPASAPAPGSAPAGTAPTRPPGHGRGRAHEGERESRRLRRFLAFHRRALRARARRRTAITVGLLGASLFLGGVVVLASREPDRRVGAFSATLTRPDQPGPSPTAPVTPRREETRPAPASQNQEQRDGVADADQRRSGADLPPPVELPPRQWAARPEPSEGGTGQRNTTPTAAGSPAASPGLPRAGGELTFLVPSEPPSYDAHREETFALMHPAAPHYNTLLRIDPFDRTGTRVVGDLAESWAVSPDKRTYVLKLRRGVKFHDGSELTSRDVRATYEKIMTPPPGVTSARKGEYLDVETVQAPEPYIIAFKLRWPSPSFIHSLASPWNWIYKADILERDIRWYETHIMGTGPFVFVDHLKGSHWVGSRNAHYWDHGKPYLDGYRAFFVRDDAAQTFAMRAERAHIQFRGFSPAQRDDIVRTLGEKVTVQEGPWNCRLLVAMNHQRKPFDDRRVRRALSLALDRHQAADALSRVAFVREVAGVQVPGSPFATPPDELGKLAGYGRDITTSRAEARRLLTAAGIDGRSTFVLKNRNIPMPYEYLGTWLVDQWRRIGLQVRQETQESGLYFRDLRSGNFELSTDFQCGYVVDPDLDLYKFQSAHRSDANYGRYTDPVLDDLYVLQSRTVDPEQRRRHIRAFERRLLDEEVHVIYTLQWHRIVPHSSRVRGWTITPSHYLNNQLDTVWLDG